MSAPDSQDEPRGRALGAAFRARALAHFSKDGIVPVDIPELAANGTPFRVYVSPMSPVERDACVKAATDKKGRVSDGEFSARAAIAKTKDADGAKIFDLRADLHWLTHEADGQIVGRIAKAIFGDSEDGDSEDGDSEDGDSEDGAAPDPDELPES